MDKIAIRCRLSESFKADLLQEGIGSEASLSSTPMIKALAAALDPNLMETVLNSIFEPDIVRRLVPVAFFTDLAGELFYAPDIVSKLLKGDADIALESFRVTKADGDGITVVDLLVDAPCIPSIDSGTRIY